VTLDRRARGHFCSLFLPCRHHQPPPSPATVFTDHRLHRPPSSPTTVFTDHRLHRPPSSPTTVFTDHVFTDHRLHRPPSSPTTVFTDRTSFQALLNSHVRHSGSQARLGHSPRSEPDRSIAWIRQCVFSRGGHRDRPRRRDARGDLDPAREPGRRLSLPDELGRGG
jgi:hypothetical protein